MKHSADKALLSKPQSLSCPIETKLLAVSKTALLYTDLQFYDNKFTQGLTPWAEHTCPLGPVGQVLMLRDWMGRHLRSRHIIDGPQGVPSST